MKNKKHSEQKVNLPDGEYQGIWSAYTLQILPPPIVVRTIDGIRGVNCKAKVIVKDGEIIDII